MQKIFSPRLSGNKGLRIQEKDSQTIFLGGPFGKMVGLQGTEKVVPPVQ